METIDNIKLINNGLMHIEYEMLSHSPSLFRVLREMHSVFYHSMIEVLRGTDNFFITGRNGDKDKKLSFKSGDDHWKEVKKGAVINGCKKAWRFTEPKKCEEPDSLGDPVSDEEWKKNQKWLVAFYEALAMVQSQPFMARYTCSNILAVSDEEMKIIEWVHENIRNEYEHFVPKIYSSDQSSLILGVLLLLDKSEYLLFESGNVLYSNSDLINKMRTKFCCLRCKLKG